MPVQRKGEEMRGKVETVERQNGVQVYCSSGHYSASAHCGLGIVQGTLHIYSLILILLR